MVCWKDGNWQISLYQWLAAIGYNSSYLSCFSPAGNSSRFRVLEHHSGERESWLAGTHLLVCKECIRRTVPPLLPI